MLPGGNRCPPCCRTLLLQLEEERKKLVEAINVTFGHLGQVGAAAQCAALLLTRGQLCLLAAMHSCRCSASTTDSLG